MKIRKIIKFYTILILILLVSPVGVNADSWVLPGDSTFKSKNGDFILVVIPPKIDHGRKSIKGIPSDFEKSWQEKGSREECLGQLKKLEKDGGHVIIWASTMSNRIAPVEAIVSNNGEYVVTFDNWHSVGYGQNTVVIYDAKGQTLRELALSDFLSDKEIEKLQHTQSSIWWGRNHFFDPSQKFVVLRIVVNGKMPGEREAKFRNIWIRLLDGSVSINPTTEQ